MSNMSDFEQLKPCPFCGGEVNLEQTINRTGWGVVCRNSLNLGGTCSIEQIPSKEKQAAITRWNTRAAKQSMQGEAKPVGKWSAQRFKNRHLYLCFEGKPITRIEGKDKNNTASIIANALNAPESAARIAEQNAEIARLTKELEEARKDAEVVAWYRETAGGIAICYVQNEPPKDADGPWHPLYTSARKTWIPMDKQHPLEEHGNKVLGLADDGYVFQCEYVVSDGEGAWCNITGETMTHWMPMPPRPDASLNIKGGAE